MNTAFESIKAGLKQAIAHQEKKANEIIVHEQAGRSTEAKHLDAKRKR